jgi:hypothetical protein
MYTLGMKEVINRRSKKPSNFDEFKNGRYRTRLPIPPHLKLFFPNTKASFELGWPTKYLSSLIENYNNLGYEEAVSEHYLNFKKFRDQLTEAEAIYQLILADGHEEPTRRLIQKFKARVGTLPFSDANLSVSQLKQLVSLFSA